MINYIGLLPAVFNAFLSLFSAFILNKEKSIS